MKIKNSLSLVLFSSVFVLSTTAQIIVFSDDFEDEIIGATPSVGGSNAGDSYTIRVGANSIESNPETLGNASSQVYRGGGVTDNFSNVMAHFGTDVLLDGLSLSYDFYISGDGGNANEGVRLALVGNANPTADTTFPRDLFIRNDRDGSILLVWCL